MPTAVNSAGGGIMLMVERHPHPAFVDLKPLIITPQPCNHSTTLQSINPQLNNHPLPLPQLYIFTLKLYNYSQTEQLLPCLTITFQPYNHSSSPTQSITPQYYNHTLTLQLFPNLKDTPQPYDHSQTLHLLPTSQLLPILMTTSSPHPPLFPTPYTHPPYNHSSTFQLPPNLTITHQLSSRSPTLQLLTNFPFVSPTLQSLTNFPVTP